MFLGIDLGTSEVKVMRAGVREGFERMDQLPALVQSLLLGQQEPA